MQHNTPQTTRSAQAFKGSALSILSLMLLILVFAGACKQEPSEAPVDVRDPFIGNYEVHDSLFYPEVPDSIGNIKYKLARVTVYPKVALRKATVFNADWNRNELGITYHIVERNTDSSGGSAYGMSYDMDFLVSSSTSGTTLVNTNSTKFSSIRGEIVRGQLYFTHYEMFSFYSRAHFIYRE